MYTCIMMVSIQVRLYLISKLTIAIVAYESQLLFFSSFLASTLALPTALRQSVLRDTRVHPTGIHASRQSIRHDVRASVVYCHQDRIPQYPSEDCWLPFPRLWSINSDIILSSNGGDTYIQHYVHEAILQVAAESDVDARLILALVMQEVRVTSLSLSLIPQSTTSANSQ